jgi:heme/copper-type cytochrome/quinol oxidase subunit 2
LKEEDHAMKRFNSIWTSLRGFAAAVACWAIVGSSVLAAANDADAGEEKGYGTWVMAYMLVILFMVLGMLFVLRSAKRRDRAKPETYGETKPTEKYGKKEED